MVVSTMRILGRPNARLSLSFVLLASFLVISLTTFLVSRRQRYPSPLQSIVSYAPQRNLTSSIPGGDPWSYQPDKHANRYTLTTAQCHSAFPHLFYEVDRAVKDRKSNPIQQNELSTSWRDDGLMRCLIHNNELYVVDAHGVTNKFHRPRAMATLHAIHRAVTSATEELPDIEFTFSVHDAPDVDGEVEHTVWGYSRLPEQKRVWLIPDFSFWGWPDVNLRSWPDVREGIATQSILDVPREDDYKKRDVEEPERRVPGFVHPTHELAFGDKIPQLIWRGALGVAPGIRGALVAESEGQDWSAVRTLDWSNKTNIKTNLISMTEHCRYRFVAQTEGNTYSARLKYLLQCGSLVLAHDMRFLEHFTHLLRSEGPEQNFVLLRSDWKDLKRTMKHWLSADGKPGAKKIAQRSKEVFRDRYLTPAAEACYFRELIKGWGKVQGFTPEFWTFEEVEVEGVERIVKKPRATPFESYALMEMTDWDMPAKPRHVVEYED